MKICDYCNEREGKFKMTSGKWCCENYYTKCPSIKQKISKGTKEGMDDPELKKKMSEQRKGCPGYWLGKKRPDLSENMKGKNNPLYGKTPWNKGLKNCYSEETIKKMIESGKNRFTDEERIKFSKRMKKLWKTEEYRNKLTNEKASNWKGGKYSYCHYITKEQFGKDHCEICGITEDECIKINNRKLSMHCRNKDWTDLTPDNWITVCEFGCHQKIEKIDN